MKKILILLITMFSMLGVQAQDITISTASDTTSTVIAVGDASTVTIKADVTPLTSSLGTGDTILVYRYLFNTDEVAYHTVGDTIVVTDATLNTTIKTYTSNYFSYYKLETRSDTTSTATLKVYVKRN